MLQVALDHLLRHLPHRYAKVAPRSEVPFPLPSFQLWKLLEQFARTPPLDAPHDLARSHCRQRAHQNMYMVASHHPTQNPYLERFARLSHQFSYPLGHITLEHLVAVLRQPPKVVLNVETVWLP